MIKPRPLKLCNRCGQMRDAEAFFRSGRGGRHVHLPTKRSVCIGCEVTARTERKQHSRWIAKARSTRQHHAIRFRITAKDLEVKYGWDTSQMAHDAEHTFKNGCHYCLAPFSSMANGLADLSLDINDRDREPFYVGNTRWACLTCNRQKSTMSPEIWARRLLEWKAWKSDLERRTANPLCGLPLFDAVIASGLCL